MFELPRDRMQVWGHRGASAHARENTLEAFRVAAAQGADGVELDVRCTRDAQLVIHHNAVTEDGRVIVECTAADLQLHEPWIPTLAETMVACSGLTVNIEIKNSPGDPDFSSSDEQAEHVVAFLDPHHHGPGVVVSSFNPATIDRVRDLDADLATAQLLGPGSNPTAELANIAGRGHHGVNPGFASIDDAGALVAAAAAHQLWVAVWTVDDPVAIRQLADSGVAAVITNDPAQARRAVG